ncbi:hypothetical protein FDI40_gp567 [Agrobacterium phage Atu_ph07]|uniref:Uncharacterized protein n=1 Tax=Agrobacterium phage Atu_ph07 TaxID=2024264 RepID=A0A2L0V0N2_9CAUD|nr:hypothetical protein FDI40_gp567 [Agrobacterium phage Atu_ph07]AUZ95326.1 hypothetical protein [Agrobacterium phage Atu_ph07]
MSICSSKGEYSKGVLSFNGNELSIYENGEITTNSVIMIKSHKTGNKVAFVLRSVGETYIPARGESIEYVFEGLAKEYSHLKVKVVWY